MAFAWVPLIDFKATVWCGLFLTRAPLNDLKATVWCGICLTRPLLNDQVRYQPYLVITSINTKYRIYIKKKSLIVFKSFQGEKAIKTNLFYV